MSYSASRRGGAPPDDENSLAKEEIYENSVLSIFLPFFLFPLSFFFFFRTGVLQQPLCGVWIPMECLLKETCYKERKKEVFPLTCLLYLTIYLSIFLSLYLSRCASRVYPCFSMLKLRLAKGSSSCAQLDKLELREIFWLLLSFERARKRKKEKLTKKEMEFLVPTSSDLW